MNRIKGLDALRAIAVLLVVKSHWGPGRVKSIPIFDFIIIYTPQGIFAVDLFFVLSGFLITIILLESKQNTVKANFQVLKTFVIRRSLRIFPVYYIFLLLLLVVNYPDISKYFVYFATYTSNYLSFKQLSWNAFSHTWTLSVEEQFYLIWPLLILFVPNKYLLKLFVLIIVASTCTDVITEHLYGSFANILTGNCLNAFAIGALYSLVVLDEKQGPIIKAWLKYLLPVAIVVYLLQYAGFAVLSLRFAHSIIAINVIIYITEHKYGKIGALLWENKTLNSIGKVSYGVYLFHYVIPHYYYLLLTRLGMDGKKGFSGYLYKPLIAEFIQLAFLFAVSYFSFYFIEKQFLKLKGHFKYRNFRNNQKAFNT